MALAPPKRADLRLPGPVIPPPRRPRMTDPVSHPVWCDPARCNAAPDRPTGTHCSRLIRLGPYPPSPVVTEVSLAQSAALPGYPSSGRPFVALATGEADDPELSLTPLPVELAGRLARAVLDFLHELDP